MSFESNLNSRVYKWKSAAVALLGLPFLLANQQCAQSPVRISIDGIPGGEVTAATSFTVSFTVDYDAGQGELDSIDLIDYVGPVAGPGGTRPTAPSRRDTPARKG